MKNNRVLLGIGFGVIFALYNILVFTLASNYTTVFWFAYGFTVLAFILQIVGFFISYGRKSTTENIFFGAPLTVIGIIYLCIQIMISSAFMIFANMSLKTTNLAQIIVLAVYIVFCIVALFAKSTVSNIDDKTKDKLLFIKLLENDVLALKDKIRDPAINTRLENLTEIIKYSDPMSHPSLALLEQKISAKINQLAEKAETGKMADVDNLCNEIEILMADRNRKCKILK